MVSGGLSYLKKITPAPLRRLARLALRGSNGGHYSTRTQQELNFFGEDHDLPAVAHYWSNKYLAPMLRPFGFTGGVECIRGYLAQLCRSTSDDCVFLSIGTGPGSYEIAMAEWLREQGLNNFTFECLDVNETLLLRGKERASERGLSDRFAFNACDINRWVPQRTYDAVVAIQSLHHVVRLEQLFDAVKGCLRDHGYFLVDDMIGRNGHRRWPEALKIIRELWKELPDKYKRNRQTGRLEKRFVNFDCSKEGFEGIRAQDILPLLIQRFHFECFFAFGNVVDVFVDRSFGPNFDVNAEWDTRFIDRVHALDVSNLERGTIKPTHMIAVMVKSPVESPRIYKHFTPQYCVCAQRSRCDLGLVGCCRRGL